MKKILKLRAVQTLKGDEAAIAEILRALTRAKGNMREACELLGVGKSSMYRLIKDLGCADAVDKVVRELDSKIQGKVLPERRTRAARAAERVAEQAAEVKASKGPRMRVKQVAA